MSELHIDRGSTAAPGLDSLTPELMDLRWHLWANVARLNLDELRVIDRIAGRLVQGRTEYGPLDLAGDERDFEGEYIEELDDALAWLAMHTLRELARHGRTR